MSDYIKKEDAIKAIKKDVMGGLNYESILNRLPSDDVVEVVRCKDCKHWLPHTQFGFDYDEAESWDADDYCSYGEKKEESWEEEPMEDVYEEQDMQQEREENGVQ